MTAEWTAPCLFQLFCVHNVVLPKTQSSGSVCGSVRKHGYNAVAYRRPSVHKVRKYLVVTLMGCLWIQSASALSADEWRGVRNELASLQASPPAAAAAGRVWESHFVAQFHSLQVLSQPLRLARILPYLLPREVMDRRSGHAV